MNRSWKAVLLCLALGACSKDDANPPPTDSGNGNQDNPPPTQTGPAMLIGAEDARLLQFRAGSPGTILAEQPLTGYFGEAGDNPPSIIGMDFRTNGVLYVLMSDNRLYTVDPATGAATLVGPLAVGSAVIVGFSWDTARDRIRAIGTLGENFDLNPDGTLFTRDADLAYASGDPNAGHTPDVEAISFTGTNGSASTTAYGIDSTSDALVTVGNVSGSPNLPDSGQVYTVHVLSTSVGGAGPPAFDVETVANPAGYLADYDGTTTQLFKVNLADGTLLDLGEVGHERRIQSLTVVPGTSGTPDTGGGAVVGDELCTTPIQGPGASFQVGSVAPTCLSCDVQNPGNLVDADPNNFARFQYSVSALLAGIDVTVTAAAGTVYPAGQIAGGVFAFPPNPALEVTVAPDVTITTLLAGEDQESTTLGGDTIVFDLGGAVESGDRFFAGFTTTKPFDAIRVLPSDGVIGALTSLDLYRVCAGAPDEGAFP